MDGVKMWCLQASLEFLSEQDQLVAAQTITDYADHFYTYLQPTKDTAQVVPFKPQGVN